MRTQTETDRIMQTMDYQAIFKNRAPSVYQMEDIGTGFVPHDGVRPNSKISCDVFFNSKDITREEHHIIRYKVSNSDAVNSPTFLMECFTHFDEIVIEVNDSKYKLEFKGLDFIMNCVSQILAEQGLTIYEFMTRFREEWDTFNGTEVQNGADRTFHYPLFLFLDWARQMIPNGFVQKIRVTLRVTPEASDAKSSALICRSDTTANAYTRTNITFNDIDYVRCYTILQDERLMARPPLDRVLLLHPQVEIKTFSNIAWNSVGVNSVSFKLSEIGIRDNIQSLTCFVRPNASAYNTATAGKRFGGWHHILWSIRELAGEKFELDFTKSEHMCRMYELAVHNNRYGTQLPDAVWKDTSDLSKYYLNMTNIYFDYNKIDPATNEIINTLNNDFRDWTVTLVCNGSVGANCDLVVLMNYYVPLRFDPANQIVEAKNI
ncbi:MAG: hypothetical protein Q8J97_15265 [Flavobacteriaceae bacterium]|nr:hypothetical protein [Flavobacteriaceae bacterium]